MSTRSTSLCRRSTVSLTVLLQLQRERMVRATPTP